MYITVLYVHNRVYTCVYTLSLIETDIFSALHAKVSFLLFLQSL